MRISNKATFVVWIALLLGFTSCEVRAQSANDLFYQGQQAWLIGDLEAARVAFQKMERLAPPDKKWQAQCSLGNLFQQQKKFDQAIKAFESIDRATLPNPIDDLMPLALAECHLQVGDAAKARLECASMDTDSLSESTVKIRWGIMGRSSLALEEYDRARAELIQCTTNQFSRALLMEAIDEYRNVRPRHMRGAIAVSQLIPGVLHLYRKDAPKAIGNFALIGAIAGGGFIFWPASLQLALFGGIDWMVQGAPSAREKLETIKFERRAAILEKVDRLTKNQL